MDFLSKGISAVLGGSGDTTQPTGAETVERLCDRLQSATLLDDRRDAVRALRSLSKKFKLEVGTQAMDLLVSVLEKDKSDVEMSELALETMGNIVAPDTTEDGERAGVDLGVQFTEILLKKQENILLLLSFVEEYDFHVRWPAVKLFHILANNKGSQMQDLVLTSPMGISRLMDLLSDSREIIRNESVLVLLNLTKSNAQIQKIVAFENAFDRLLDIITEEGLSDGGIVVEDCILLIQSLLKSNNLNQNFFREASLIPRLVSFFELKLPAKPGTALSWDLQKVNNILQMLKLVRLLVSPVNPQQATAGSQKSMHQCGLIKLLCAIMFSSGMPSHVLTEAINTVAEVIRGSPPNQEFFSQVKVPSDPPRPAILAVITSMVTEKQPLELRCAALYCFQSYILKNAAYQAEVVSTLLPSSADAAQSVSAGQLLCTGLFSPDQLSVWCASIALMSTLGSILQKEQLLRVQLAAAADQPPMTLLQLCVNLLAQGTHVQSRVALMVLLTTWLSGCASCINVFLTNQSNMSFLTGLAEHEPDSEQARLLQGLSCLILGICLVDHPGTELPYTKDTLHQIIGNRIGSERFGDSLSFVSQSEHFTRAAKHPQPGYARLEDILFDSAFTVFFKQQTDVIMKAVNAPSGLSPSSESASGRNSPTAPATRATVEDHDSIVMSYKELIRDQDQQLVEMRRKLEGIGGERDNALTSNREQSKIVETLLKQNAEMKQLLESRNQTTAINNGSSSADSLEVIQLRQQVSNLQSTQSVLENELQQRDTAIDQLQGELSRSRQMETESRRLAESARQKASSGLSADEQMRLQQETAELRTKVQEMSSQIQSVVRERDEWKGHVQQLEEVNELQKKTKKELETVRRDYDQLKKDKETVEKEQEDLLCLLSDNNEKRKKLKERLRQLGQTVSEEEDAEDDDEDEEEEEDEDGEQ